jgi:hypothetical protein
MLIDLAIRKAGPREKAYKLSDGGGLYLLVTTTGQRYWRMDYRFAEKRATAAGQPDVFIVNPTHHMLGLNT